MKTRARILTILILIFASALYAWQGDIWGSISRQTITANAGTMMDSTWSPLNDIVNYDVPTGTVGRAYSAGTTYAGELYTSSARENWTEFYNSVMNTPGGRTTYGNNCDGFVNICWQLPTPYNIPKINTSLGGSYFYALGEVGDAPFLALLPGDALYNSGHIFLFSKYNPDGTIESMEQVPPAARRRIWSWNALKTFRPIRRNLVEGGFIVSDRVQTSSNVPVRSCPSFNCDPIWTATIAAQGAIVDGPQNAEKYRWWKVQYDGVGTTGWVTEGYLKKLVDQTLSCNGPALPTGTIAINAGAGYANAGSVMLTLSCTDSGSDCAWMRFSGDSSTWSPWESFSNFKNWTLPSGDGPKNVYVQFADACGNTSASSGASIMCQTATPDLAISSLTAPSGASAGATINITDIVNNTGSGGANASITTFFFSANPTPDSGAVVIGNRSVPALGGGTSNMGTTSVTIPSSLPAGIFYIIARANSVTPIDDCSFIAPCGSMIETTRNNNTKSVKINVGPDLIVSSLNASIAGTTITITDTTKNSGGSLANSSATSFYLSIDTILDSADTLLGSRSVPTLAASAVSTATTSVAIPSGISPGTYYIIAKADASNGVVEANENNNTKDKAIQVH